MVVPVGFDPISFSLSTISTLFGIFGGQEKDKPLLLTRAQLNEAFRQGAFSPRFLHAKAIEIIDGIEPPGFVEGIEKCLDDLEEFIPRRKRPSFREFLDEPAELDDRSIPRGPYINCYARASGIDLEDAAEEIQEAHKRKRAGRPGRDLFRGIEDGTIDPSTQPVPSFVILVPDSQALPPPPPVPPSAPSPTPSLIPKIEIPLPGTGGLPVDITPAIAALPQIITDLVTGSRSDTSRVVSSITSLATQLLTGQRQVNNILASVLIEIAGKFLGPLLPESRAARQALQLLTAIALEQIGPDLSRIARVSLPQVVSVLGGLNQTLGLGTQGIIATLRQAAQRTAGSTLAAADLQAANLDNFLPTLDQWLAKIDRGEDISGGGFTDALAGIFRTISAPENGFPGEAEIPVKQVEKDLRVLTVDQISPWLEQGESFSKASVLKFLGPLASGAMAAATYHPAVQEKILDLASTFTSMVEDKVTQFRDVKPGDGFTNAAFFLKEALIFGIRAHAVATALEIAGPTAKSIGANQIAGLVAAFAGFAPITNAIWGRSIGNAVAIPAQYQINSIMHQNLLGEGEVDRAFGRRFIDETTYRELLSFYANSKEDQDLKVKLAFRPPSMSDTIRIVRTSTLGAADIKAFLTEGGYPEDLINQMIKPILQAAENSERTTLRFETRGGLAAGTVSPAEAELVFDRLDMRPGSREIVLKTGALQKRRIAMVAHAGVLESNFQSDAINIFDLQSGLLNLGFQPDMVDIRISRAQEKRLGKTMRTAAAGVQAIQRKRESLIVAALKEQFKLGLIDRAFFLLLLQTAGVDPFVAAGTVALESIKLTGREIHTEQAQVARLEQQQISLRQNIFLEQFRKGQITEEQLVRNLLSLNLDPQIIEDQVVKEKLGKIPIKKREFAPPEEVKARELNDRAEALLLIKFRRGEIDSDVLQSGLIELGGDPDLVQADVEIEVARRFRELQPPGSPKVDPQIAASKRRQISDLQRAFSDKVISADTFADQLSRLVSSSDLIEALLEEGFLERALKEAKVAGSA